VRKWLPLAVLSAAQFLVVLDSAVMNVAISTLVDDFDTTVTTIQGVITLYALVMASLMLTGGKIGDIIGRRRTFSIGLVIYAVGSAITAVSQDVLVLGLGWSVLEGVGAALVMPALVALVAGNYRGRDRVAAFGVIGGIAGVGIAVGPILGGWLTTFASWRLVFVGEVVVAMAILLLVVVIREAERPSPRPRLDVLGAILSASGLGLAVFSVLQTSSWGWIKPVDSPVEPFGLALTPFVFGAGLALLWAFVEWERRREQHGETPLLRLGLLKIPPLRSGVSLFLLQNLVLMGVFFTIPLYLQLVQGLNAFDTGKRMLPVSITMLVVSMSGPLLASRAGPRRVVRAGYLVLAFAIILLLGTIQPELNGVGFGFALAMLGVGMGLIASQLGNIVQSTVGERDRSEAGGLQTTAQQLGSSLGTALIGAIVLSGLTATFVNAVAADERISGNVKSSLEARSGVVFVNAGEVEQAATDADLPPEEVERIVDAYEDSQLIALKVGLLAAAFIALGALILTRDLPWRKLTDEGAVREGAPAP